MMSIRMMIAAVAVGTARMSRFALTREDALVVVDVQNDFVTGSLAVPSAREVVPALNRYLRLFDRFGLTIAATRDWHPLDHCSFREHGGRWPTHCIADSAGAEFASGLALPAASIVVAKATDAVADAYSGFAGTDLHRQLARRGIRRLLVGGLATDYCVLHTVLDARRLGYAVLVLVDAIRAVDAVPGDGARAEASMVEAGALPIVFEDLALADAA